MEDSIANRKHIGKVPTSIIFLFLVVSLILSCMFAPLAHAENEGGLINHSPMHAEGEQASPSITPVLPPPLDADPGTTVPSDPLAKRPLMIAILSIALVCSLLLLVRVAVIPSFRRKKRRISQGSSGQQAPRKRQPPPDDLDLVDYTYRSTPPLGQRDAPPMGGFMYRTARAQNRPFQDIEVEEEDLLLSTERAERSPSSRRRPISQTIRQRKPTTYAARRRRLTQENNRDSTRLISDDGPSKRN